VYIASILAGVLQKQLKETTTTYLVAQWLGAKYIFYQCTYETTKRNYNLATEAKNQETASTRNN
jgi:hypothetical protein